MEQPPSAAKTILDNIQAEHEDQFNIAVNAAFQRGFGRWFDDTWTSARAAGARPNPFISSMFVFITTMLMKKFVAGMGDAPLEMKEQGITEAVKLLKGYLDQIEASAVKDIHTPKPVTDPNTSGGNEPAPKQSIILPKKKRFHA